MAHSYPALFCLLFACATATAQPTIDQDNFATSIGESFVINAGPWMDPGASGMDVIWDFTGLTIDSTFTDTYEDPIETPDGTSFPTATLALAEQGGYSYLSFDAAAGSFLGISLPGGQGVIAYSDPELIFQFPCAYTTQWSDDFYAEFTAAGFDVIRSGTLTAEADGYGTLQLPNGNFDNTLRIHLNRVYTDASFATIEYEDDFYYYLRPGTHYPLVEVFSNTVTFFGNPTVITGVNWLNDPSTSVAVNTGQANALIAIAQGDGLVRLDIALAEPGAATMEIIDAAGRRTTQESLGVLTSGASSRNVSLPSLASGLYSVRLLSGGLQLTTRLFVP